MIISEVLDAIDIINSITLESEIDTCESLLNSYDKMLIIEENYNSNDINDFKIFQEGFGDDVKSEMKKSGKNMGTLMKILTALPRFIIAIVKSIKNRLSKKTKDTAKEINDNVKKLSDEQKKGLAQLFPKDRKGKIDAKKIIRGMLGGVAVVGGVIAIGKFKIPKKLAEQTKHVLGKLKGKKSNNPKPANKKSNVVQNKNNSPVSDDKSTNNGGNSVNDEELFDEISSKDYDKIHKKLNEFITVSYEDTKIFVDTFGELAEADKTGLNSTANILNSSNLDIALENIINNNENIQEKLGTGKGKQLIEKAKSDKGTYETYDDQIDVITGMILTIINDTVKKAEQSFVDKIENLYKLFNEIGNKLNDINAAFIDYNESINHRHDIDRNEHITLSSSEFMLQYISGDESIQVRAEINNYCFYMLARSKYFLSHDASSGFNKKDQQNVEEIQRLKREFGIEKDYYVTGGGDRYDPRYIPIDTFVDELNSYIDKTLDPNKINKQIDDIMEKCKLLNKDAGKYDVYYIKSSIQDIKKEMLYISNIIHKINELITELNDFIKTINEIEIPTTDKKLHEVKVAEIRDID